MICMCCAKVLSRVQLFVMSWTVAHQAPLSMGFSRKNAGIGCHAPLQGIFSTQASNPGLPHCRRILYHLSHQGSLVDEMLFFSTYLFFFFLSLNEKSIICHHAEHQRIWSWAHKTSQNYIQWRLTMGWIVTPKNSCWYPKSQYIWIWLIWILQM